MTQSIHLTPRQKQALKIIRAYLEEKGQRCFSYDGIIPYFLRHYHDVMPAATFDRRIRELAEMGILERREVKTSESKPSTKRKSVIFCWTERAEAIYNAIVEKEQTSVKQEARTLDQLLKSYSALNNTPASLHELEFFATGAPTWWPYHVVTLDTPLSNPRGKIILHDNGAFRIWRQQNSVDVDVWVAKLARSVNRYVGVADEVRVVLPDKIGDTKTTLELHERAYRVFCKDTMRKRGVRCVGVVQMDKYTSTKTIADIVDHYINNMPDIEIIAVPAKAPFAVRAGDRLVVNDVYVIGAVGRVYDAVKGRRAIHALAPQLRTPVLRRIAPMIHSFDTTSWTRPITSELRRLGIRHSAKTAEERELMFAYTVVYLHHAGIPLKHVDLAEARLPQDVINVVKRRLGERR